MAEHELTPEQKEAVSIIEVFFTEAVRIVARVGSSSSGPSDSNRIIEEHERILISLVDHMVEMHRR